MGALIKFQPLAWANAVAILMQALSLRLLTNSKSGGNPTTAARPFPSRPGIGIIFVRCSQQSFRLTTRLLIGAAPSRVFMDSGSLVGVVLSQFKSPALSEPNLSEPSSARILLPFRQDIVDELHPSGGVLEHLGIQVQFMPTIRTFAMHPHCDVIAHRGQPLLQVFSECLPRLLAAAECLSTFVRSKR